MGIEGKCQEIKRNYPELQFPSRPTSRQQTCSSLSDENEKAEETISALVTVHRAHICDLTSAFAEGFLGYSVDVQIGDINQETIPADVYGQASEWEASFSL